MQRRSMAVLAVLLVTGLTTGLAAVAVAGEDPVPSETVAAKVLRARKGELAGKTVKITGTLHTSAASFYGCAFRDRKKWQAVTLADDSGERVIAYCPRASTMLDCAELTTRGSKIMYAIVAVPAKATRCKQLQVELLSY